jgi:hypothetical protein
VSDPTRSSRPGHLYIGARRGRCRADWKWARLNTQVYFWYTPFSTNLYLWVHPTPYSPDPKSFIRDICWVNPRQWGLSKRSSITIIWFLLLDHSISCNPHKSSWFILFLDQYYNEGKFTITRLYFRFLEHFPNECIRYIFLMIWNSIRPYIEWFSPSC